MRSGDQLRHSPPPFHLRAPDFTEPANVQAAALMPDVKKVTLGQL